MRGDSLAGAILTTLAYSDIFSFAPTAAEVHRFLIGHPGTRAEVHEALESDPDLQRIVGRDGDLFFFRGKGHLALRRRRFAKHSEYRWPEAKRMAKWVERSGLATCGLVTGSLASNNADEHADIDFLFIYPAERTYLSFAGIRMLVNMPGAGLDIMCPNYCLPDSHLLIQPQNLFTAWEIAKAVPMFGFDVYADFAGHNRWVRDYLPNALPVLDAKTVAPGSKPKSGLRKLGSKIIRSPLGRELEAKERARKQGNDRRDVGVDMKAREERGSVDRHSPTRSFHTLCELRYRMEQFALQGHPVFEEVAKASGSLGTEMSHWGSDKIDAIPTTP
jgi:hypothetical protein